MKVLDLAFGWLLVMGSLLHGVGSFVAYRDMPSRYLDATPKGRGEGGPYNTLAEWGRPNNAYGNGGWGEGNERFHRPDCACGVHEAAAAWERNRFASRAPSLGVAFVPPEGSVTMATC